MDYLEISDIALQWGISERRVRVLCAEGKISGAYQQGRGWKIPSNAVKPADGRYKAVVACRC